MLPDRPTAIRIPLIASIKTDNSFTTAAIIIAKPNVTSPRNHSFNLTHIIPKNSPTRDAASAPVNTPNTGVTPFMIRIVEAKPPIPRKAACPRDACPEYASKANGCFVLKMTGSFLDPIGLLPVSWSILDERILVYYLIRN